MRWAELYPNMKFGLAPGKGCARMKENIPLSKILIETDAPYFPPFLVSQVLLIVLDCFSSRLHDEFFL